MDNSKLDIDKQRCAWVGNDALYVEYHDTEWGVPVADDMRLFEKVCLEGFQAGLSWLTILKKRENFRAAFNQPSSLTTARPVGFDFEMIAQYGAADVNRLLQDAGIIRHRGKIEATINNAARALEMRDEFGSLAAYFWQFEPDTRGWAYDADSLKARTVCPESLALSKDLKKRGWKFVGPTTMYALMQAMGMVNDHVEGCYCRAGIEGKRSVFKRPKPC